MNQDAIEIARRLADILARENDALRRSDYPAAVALVPDKEAAIVALSQAATTAIHTPVLKALAKQLRDLAADNQDLLKQAVEVQTQIVSIVARAASQSMANDYYDRNGQFGKPAKSPALALSAQI